MAMSQQIRTRPAGEQRGSHPPRARLRDVYFALTVNLAVK